MQNHRINTIQAMRLSFTNPDLVVCILMCLPDFQSLASILMTSKTINNIFQHHPHSIVRSVAYNVVGPALPQALRFVRCRQAQLIFKPVSELWGEDDIQKNPVLFKEITSLVATSNSVRELEDMFSWRMKDRRFKTSQLTLAESTRFWRAMYRLSLYSAIYGHNAHDDTLSDSERVVKEEEAKKLRRSFFGSFSTPELREIQSVEAFLRNVLAASACCANLSCTTFNEWTTFELYCDPLKVLDVYKGEASLSVDDFDMEDEESFFHDFVTGPLASVLADRKEPHLLPVDHKQPIIDQVVGEHDSCSQCQSEKGLALWGPSNWGFIRGRSPLHPIETLLKGYLQFNYADNSQFIKTTAGISSEQLIGGLFNYKSLAYDTWNKDDWLCDQCLKQFVRNHLHIWYLGERINQGHIIQENCWYGYNCRTQNHKLAHAQKLNHWCEPIKGDAPPT